MTRPEVTPPEPLPPTLDEALGRLAAAVTRLRAVGERHATAGGASGHGEGSGTMPEDRAGLARELDTALARVARLGDAQSEALERLGRAEASIQAVLRDLAAEDVEEPPIEEAS